MTIVIDENGIALVIMLAFLIVSGTWLLARGVREDVVGLDVLVSLAFWVSLTSVITFGTALALAGAISAS